jgi:hydrogenase expression/formation protein HypC
MCVAVPGRVLEIADEMAVVEFDGRRQRASLLLVPDTSVGDWVIVAAGTVLEVLDPGEAAEILAMITETPAQEVG